MTVEQWWNDNSGGKPKKRGQKLASMPFPPQITSLEVSHPELKHCVFTNYISCHVTILFLYDEEFQIMRLIFLYYFYFMIITIIIIIILFQIMRLNSASSIKQSYPRNRPWKPIEL
jgi:hypothetical protein